ncbi:MAG: hypothetical protein HQK51_12080 [Oligoflexia bacterium]|nr:hypothetical protein [Oligoflexia bacterium]
MATATTNRENHYYKTKIGLIQLNSKLNPLENISFIRNLIPQVKSEGISLLFLPEYFYSLGKNYNTPHLVELNNEHYENILSLATECGVYLLGGTAATRSPANASPTNTLPANTPPAIYNRTYNFSPSGELLPHYDKINLFKCNLSNLADNKSHDESKIYTAGTTPLALTLNIPFQELKVKIGFGVCFDLRFPELFRNYVSKYNVQLLSICAAFTVATGKAHWHTLLRARAIENQAYVVAAAQVGHHDGGITTYGHSLIIDPWGEIIVDAGGNEDNVGLWSAEIDLLYLDEVRSRMSVFNSINYS